MFRRSFSDCSTSEPSAARAKTRHSYTKNRDVYWALHPNSTSLVQCERVSLRDDFILGVVIHPKDVHSSSCPAVEASQSSR
jgi:hypothetical protein